MKCRSARAGRSVRCRPTRRRRRTRDRRKFGDHQCARPERRSANRRSTPPCRAPFAQSIGTAIPNYDPASRHNSTGRTRPRRRPTPSPPDRNSLVTDTTLFNAGIQQGFASGAQVGLNFNNNRVSSNSLRSGYNPYTGSTLGFTATQPLLRGYGASLNRRFIRIAGNEQKITSLLFQQQLILTVYGVIRLYTDLVALTEDEKVKQETVALAEKLLADVRAQVEEGTLAQVEMTRANAQVFSTRQDLINARGLREEQEAIFKNVITRRGNEDPEVAGARIIPTDTLTIPATDELRPMQDLIADALAHRPDLGQARLQIANSQIGLRGRAQPDASRSWTWSASCRTTDSPGRRTRSCPIPTPDSSAATAACWTRFSRASIPPTASACR